MAERIRFDSVRRLWWGLAQFLDPPSTTEFNNWEAVSELLDFKPLEINQIRSLKDETGSNTMIMFKHYVQKTNGGDLKEIVHILKSLNRIDALGYLASDVAGIKSVSPCVRDPATALPYRDEPMDDHHPHQQHLMQQEQRQGLQQYILQQERGQQSLQAQHLQMQECSALNGPGHGHLVAREQGHRQLDHRQLDPRQLDPRQQDHRQQDHRQQMVPEYQQLPYEQQQHQQQKEGHQHPRQYLHQYQAQPGDHRQEPSGGPSPPHNLPQRPPGPVLPADRQFQPTQIASKHQMVYQPTAKQRDSIQQQWSKRVVNRHSGMPPEHLHRNPLMPQDTPMNLKKFNTTQPQPQPQPKPYDNFNKRTADDFFPGFGQQYAAQNPGESNPSMHVQCQDRNISSMNPSLSYHSAPFGMHEYPADFPEVLIRGENKLYSLSQVPLVITPLERASPKPQDRAHEERSRFRQMEVPECTISRSEVQFAGVPPISPGLMEHSPEPMDQSECTVPLTISPIKQEEHEEGSSMVTSSPPATDCNVQRHTKDFRLNQNEDFHQVPVRESVIHMGPQCNSDVDASPGDLVQYPEFSEEKEDISDGRIHSCPAYPVQRTCANEIRARCNSEQRLTWPLSALDIKKRSTPPPATTTRLFESRTKKHVTSTDKDFKPQAQEKQPIKVLLTHTLNGKDAKMYKKEIIVLYNCLKKNGFLPSVDFLEFREFSQDTTRWMDTKFKEAQFVLVCITPQYKTDVDYPDNVSPGQHNNYTRSCKYIHKLMQNEFTTQHCQNKRFKPVLLQGAELHHVPMWMQSTVAFRWRHNWKDLLYMMLEPERILAKMKKNQEKFTKAQPVIKIVQRTIWP